MSVSFHLQIGKMSKKNGFILFQKNVIDAVRILQLLFILKILTAPIRKQVLLLESIIKVMFLLALTFLYRMK